nr:hypothetical protein [Saccharothrix sp. 6-C]
MLLPGDQVHRDGAGVDRFDQLLSACHQGGSLTRQVLALLLGLAAIRGQLGPKPCLYGVAQCGIHTHRRPVVLDQLLDLRYQQRLASTGSALLVPTEAYEVRVGHAVAVLGVRDDQPAAAVAAEDTGLEVVPVVTLLLADQVRSQNILDFLPGDRVDQRLMPAGMPNTPVDDLSLVVRVG